MNRLTPAPPVGAPPRFPSGWRARLGRDPVPILLREGGPALVARVRRDLIDDDEAPGPAEVVTYPEVKAFLKKQEKNGAFPAKPPEKTLGSPRYARAVGTMRALEKMAEYGLGKAHPAVARAAELLLSSQANDGGIADLALGETPESRSRAVAIHFQGWALSTLCRTGYDADARVDKGFRFLLANRQADGGWAWRGVRTDSAARPSSHLVTGMALRAFAASATRKTSREARRAAELLATRFLQPDRYPDRKAADLLGAAGRAALLHRRAGRARLRHGRRPRQGELGRAHRRSLRARPPERRRAVVSRRAPARRAGRQAAAAQRQGSRAGALAHRTRPDCLARGVN